MRMKLESERLILRRYGDEDFDFLCSLLKQPEVMRHIGNGATRNRQEALEFMYWIYRSYREHPFYGLLLLTTKADGRPVGHAGLVRQTVNGIEELEVGYWLDPAFWGFGYATEAASLLCRVGFQQTGQTQLISLIQPQNQASVKVAEAIGMKRSFELLRNGQSVYVYKLEKERWHAISDS